MGTLITTTICLQNAMVLPQMLDAPDAAPDAPMTGKDIPVLSMPSPPSTGMQCFNTGTTKLGNVHEVHVMLLSYSGVLRKLHGRIPQTDTINTRFRTIARQGVAYVGRISSNLVHKHLCVSASNTVNVSNMSNMVSV